MAESNRKPALGHDPFAALGLEGPNAAAPSAKTAPPTRKPAAKTKPRRKAPASKTAPSKPAPKSGRPASTASGSKAAADKRPKPDQNDGTTARKTATSPKKRGAESASAAKSPAVPVLDQRQIEARLKAAFHALGDVPLPDGPPSRQLKDEFFELLRSTLRLLTPTFYMELYRDTVLAERSLDIDPFGLDPVFEERAERLADFLYRHWWRVEAIGVDNLPAGGRTLLVANHSGMLPYDGAMIKHAVRVEHSARRTVRFLVENFVFYFPFLGTMVYRYGGVRASMDNALRLLADDQLTAVFPEGVKGLGKLYRDRYQLQRFGRGGFIKLALRARAPIVPVAVIGAEEIHPIIAHANVLAKPLRVPYVPITPTLPWLGPLGLIPLPTKWTIVFGEAMTFPLEHEAAQAEDELLVHDLTLQVRRSIHEMIYEQLAQRRSVFLG